MPNLDQVYESDWLSAVVSERWRLWSLPSRLPSEISHWTYTDAAACCSCASLVVRRASLASQIPACLTRYADLALPVVGCFIR
jgi:hypothetical protein